MGKYRFKLSDMVPYAWFYKLKDMSRASKSQSRSHHNPRTASNTSQKAFLTQRDALLPSRASYYFSSRTDAEKPHNSPLHHKASDTLFPQEPPRKSQRRSRRKPTSPSSGTSGCSRRVWQEQPIPPPDVGALIDVISSCSLTSSPTDIFIDVGAKSPSPPLQLELPPIITKVVKKEAEHAKVQVKNACRKQQQSKNTARRSPPVGLHRLRMRASSPKLAAAKKFQAGRKSVSMKQGKKLEQSFAVVKSSSDPQKDFRDSMVEMIMENDIRASQDLEELLACYLSLNSNEYHDVIVNVFEQIWFDLTDIRL